jgi:hypothetical protein
LLLAKDNEEMTAWHFASLGGKVEVLQKLWGWGKETLTVEELNNILLLVKDNEDRTARHVAEQDGNLEIFERLREWGQQTLKQRSSITNYY